ncbi:MAG: hypothetical protein IKR79_07440 [Bacteroidales bacterium]|nr:hypothetical protein [Bacteroidales bacterium]MBR6331463.1 hypothetical protein [Bacteroidales bacterium]
MKKALILLAIIGFMFQVACTDDPKWTVIVKSADNSMGYTTGSGVYDDNETAVINAIPREEYEFWKWDDENDANPREVIVNKDMTFTALFHRIGDNPSDSNDTVEYVDFNSNWVPGIWQKNGTIEFWRYKGDGTGVIWDEAEDVTEEESNLIFTWETTGYTLTLVFVGIEGQEVPKMYYLIEQTQDSMILEDPYGLRYKFNRVSI